MRVMLFLNNKCNMNCHYCYDGRKRDNTEMSKETILDAINFSKKQNEKIVLTFAGGEPSLSSHLIEFAIENSPPEFSFQIMTNGYNYSKEFFQLIEKYKDRIFITYSFDGFYQEQRKPNSTEIVLANLEKIYKITDKLQISFTMHHNSVKDLYENVKYLCKFAKSVKVKRECFGGHRWGNEFIEEFNKNIDKLIDYVTFKEATEGFSFQLPNHIQYPDVNGHPARKGGVDCIDYVIYDMVIGMDGSIYPCEYYCGEQHGSIGNVKDCTCDKEKFKNINFKIKTNYPQFNCILLNEKINNDINDNTNCVCLEVDELLQEKRAKYHRRLQQLRGLK